MYMVRIELTTKCNYRCQHCFIEDYSCEGLTTKEIFKLLDNLRKFGVFVVEFTGGEVFLRKDFLDILRYARKLKFYVSVLSNISLLTDDIIAELKTLSLDCISTTLFSMDDNINDSITNGVNTATRTINNLIKLSEAGIRIQVKTVLMKNNADEYKVISDFCDRYGLDYLATEGIFPSVKGNKDPRSLVISDSQLSDCIEYIDKRRYGGIYKEKKNADKPICCELNYSLFIDAHGDCYPCNLWYKKLGNIKEQSYKISALWNNPFLNSVRRLRWKNLPKCSKCENSEYCVRCTGIVEAVKGDALLWDEYSCRAARIRRKIDNSSHKG